MGGSAHEWSRTIGATVVPGGTLRIELVMTKWLAPDVTVGWELRVEG